jgi:hypothetical protein
MRRKAGNAVNRGGGRGARDRKIETRRIRSRKRGIPDS